MLCAYRSKCRYIARPIRLLCANSRCTCSAPEYSKYCGKHINESSTAELIQELVTLRHNPDAPPGVYNIPLARHKARSVRVRAALAFRYIVEMTDIERDDFDVWTAIVTQSQLADLVEFPTHSRPRSLRGPSSFHVGYGIANERMPPTRMDYSDSLSGEHLKWILAAGNERRILELNNNYIVIRLGGVWEVIQDTVPSSIGGSSEYDRLTETLYVLLNSAFPDTKLAQMDVDECPVCCDTKTLGKLPKCNHCVCQECWDSWNKTGNKTCPLCREVQY